MFVAMINVEAIAHEGDAFCAQLDEFRGQVDVLLLNKIS